MTRQTDILRAEIVEALREVGATVVSLYKVGGCPELLVGFRGTNYLLNVTTPTGHVAAIRWLWGETWTGQVVVVRSVDEALRAIGAIT